jgi:hypothetical protein
MFLTIRTPQMLALRRGTAFTYVPSLCDYVRKYHEAAAGNMSPETVEAFVTRAVEAATAYELYSQRDLARFVDLVMVRGLPLPGSLSKILSSQTPPAPGGRLAKAWRRLLFELEAES